MGVTPWEAIDSITRQLKEVESQERHGNLTTEQAIELTGELTTKYMQLLEMYNGIKANFAFVAIDEKGNPCFAHGEHLKEYEKGVFDYVEGLKFHMMHVQQELIDLLLNRDLLGNKAILNQILLGNVTKVDDIINYLEDEDEQNDNQ